MAVKKRSRLSEIYKAEKARGGGVLSAVGKRTLEKVDPRQLFDQESFLAAILPSLFKAYKVKTPGFGSTTRKIAPTPSSEDSIGNVLVIKELSVIRTDSKISAKNSMVLPAMARDMNLMRQNVAKLVKLQDDKPAYKADMFFKRASEREAEYESKFKKEGGATSNVGATSAIKGGGSLSGLMGGLGKGLGLAAIGAGIAGFLTALGAAGYAVNVMGGASGIKDLMVNLAEGLNAFTGQSLLALGALLGTGMLFGTVTGLKSKAGAALGITAIGLGIGGFLSGLAAGGAGVEFLGGATGVKDMLTGIAEGLNAFNTTSLAALGGLLGAGALFGVVGSLGGAKLAVGANIGIGVIGFAIGAFLTGLSAGGAGINYFGGAGGVKDMLVSVAEGLGAFTGVDAGNLAKLAGALPLFGAGLLAFFGTQGLAGIGKALGEGAGKIMDFIFGPSGEKESPLEKISKDLKLFSNVDGNNLRGVGQGLKDLASGMKQLSDLSKKDVEKAIAAARAAAAAGVSLPQLPQSTRTPQTPQPQVSAAAQEALRNMGIDEASVGGGRGMVNPPNVVPTTPTPASSSPSSSPSSGILDMIASGEAIGSDPYNSMNQGTAGGRIVGSGVSSNVIGKNLTEMTVGEIMTNAANPNDGPAERQRKGAIFAAGRYQIIPSTLKGLVDQKVASRDEKFTPEVQDRLAMALIDQSGATKSLREGNVNQAQYQLARVWAALPVPAGMPLQSGVISTGAESFYGSGNKAKAGLSLASLQNGAPPSSTSGTTLASATTETSSARMQLASAPPVIVNAPTTNNVSQGGGQRSAQYTAPAVVDSEFIKMLVYRIV
jgi:hypothetical protein